MKCPECGQNNWLVQVTEYWDFEIRDGETVESEEEIGKATVTHTCRTELDEHGTRCPYNKEEVMNLDEFILFKQEHGFDD